MAPRREEGHFSPQLFRFLRQLRKNNDRAWFEKNRSRWVEHVQEPMLRFIEDIGPPLGKVSKRFLADPRPSGGSMFRIYRDVRFSRDKSPYKTVASAQFRHEKGKDVHAPGFYLHLAPGEVFLGAGLWRPDGRTLLRIRQAIVDEPARWKRLVSSSSLGEARLSGEALKRPPRGFDADHPLVEDLKRRDFVTIVGLDETVACAPDFLERVAGAYRKRGVFMRFLTEAVGLEW
jgi:uncharacterized protein (TIGR02453 family)